MADSLKTLASIKSNSSGDYAGADPLLREQLDMSAAIAFNVIQSRSPRSCLRSVRTDALSDLRVQREIDELSIDGFGDAEVDDFRNGAAVEDAEDQFHDEVRPCVFHRARIEHSRDAGMVHDRQRLSLGLEPGDELPCVHSELQNFQGNAAGNGRGLVRGLNGSHSALAEHLQDAVRTDAFGLT